jgi:membrane protease YdiL (CAAX protease family)
VVDEGHEPAGRGPQLAREHLLALPRLPGDQREEARLGRGEVEVGDPPGEPRGGVRPDLGQRWAGTEGLTVLVVAEVYLALIAGLVIGVGGLAGARRLLALRPATPRQARSALALVVAACAAGLAVSLAFSPLSGGPVATLTAIVRAGSDESRMAAATPLVWALIVIRVAALGGIGEELLFRGALYGWLRRRLPVSPAIAVTTVLFALEHAYYPVLIPLVLACGLATGLVRHRTSGIGATIPMHIAVDLGLFLAAVALS